jgi:6-phosphogluconate dehydrogenase
MARKGGCIIRHAHIGRYEKVLPRKRDVQELVIEDMWMEIAELTCQLDKIIETSCW